MHDAARKRHLRTPAPQRGSQRWVRSADISPVAGFLKQYIEGRQILAPISLYDS